MGITYGDYLIDIGANEIAPEQEREIEARDECARRGIDPDDDAADGVTVWMVVDKELRECCDLAAKTPCPNCPAKTDPIDQCPKCGGDCSAANPPVFDCPMIGCNRDF